MTEPKSVVLPLHHGSIRTNFAIGRAKIRYTGFCAKWFLGNKALGSGLLTAGRSHGSGKISSSDNTLGFPDQGFFCKTEENDINIFSSLAKRESVSATNSWLPNPLSFDIKSCVSNSNEDPSEISINLL